jgi:hypothetical protein
MLRIAFMQSRLEMTVMHHSCPKAAANQHDSGTRLDLKRLGHHRRETEEKSTKKGVFHIGRSSVVRFAVALRFRGTRRARD